MLETVPAIGMVRPESAGEAHLLTLSVPAPFMVLKEPRTFWSPVSAEGRFLGPSVLSPVVRMLPPYSLLNIFVIISFGYS